MVFLVMLDSLSQSHTSEVEKGGETETKGKTQTRKEQKLYQREGQTARKRKEKDLQGKDGWKCFVQGGDGGAQVILMLSAGQVQRGPSTERSSLLPS